MKKTLHVKINIKALLLLVSQGVILFYFMTGCKFLDSEQQESSSGLFNLHQAQQEMGFQQSSSGKITIPEDSNASEVPKSFILGAVVLPDRDEPFDSETQITKDIATELKEGITNSANFFSITKLPTDQKFINFDVPLDAVGNWQIIAVASRKEHKTIGEFTEEELEEIILYFGFSDRFYTRSEIGKTTISMNMQRACVNKNPPKGCATYTDTGSVIVTADVEITGVEINGRADSASLFPMIVRNDADLTNPQRKLPSDVITTLEALLIGKGSLSTLLIKTTHTTNSSESSDCKALASTLALTSAQLEAVCEVQKYKVKIK